MRLGGNIAHLGRDLDLDLGPLFLLAFKDGGYISGEILELADGWIAATTGGGSRDL